MHKYYDIVYTTIRKITVSTVVQQRVNDIPYKESKRLKVITTQAICSEGCNQAYY